MLLLKNVSVSILLDRLGSLNMSKVLRKFSMLLCSNFMFSMPTNCSDSAHNEEAKILYWIVNCELQYIFYFDPLF